MARGHNNTGESKMENFLNELKAYGEMHGPETKRVGLVTWDGECWLSECDHPGELDTMLAGPAACNVYATIDELCEATGCNVIEIV
jgi:hypothetical protein